MDPVVEDNASKADQFAAAAQQLITQDEVAAVVSPNASPLRCPASDIAESSKTSADRTMDSLNPKTTLDINTANPE